MSAKTKRMRLTAFKTAFSDDTKVTLEEILRAIERDLPNHVDRVHTSSAEERSTALSRFISHPNNAGTGAVLSTYEPGASVSTLNFAASEAKILPDKQPSTEGNEFLDKNISLLVVDDIVIGCGFGKRQNFISGFLHSLAQRAGALSGIQTFNFVHIPRKGSLERIEKFGVKKIELDATVLLGDAKDALRGGTLARVFGSQSTAETLKRRRQNVATLSLATGRKFLTHFRPGIEIQEQDKNIWLDSVAREVVGDESIDQYTIILNNGQPIKSGSLLVEQVVDVAADGTSYDTNDAHEKMVDFYRRVVTDD